ncbi:YdbT family protein [Hymenobacter jejuensis]|uniref:Uncharacterized protein n=1 Tax=Hymenobacter jejuensis TaxID=2502781 RepID=A0A5B7ZZX0_9BACT|nr:hypothetical protein [Hymenobacter jejuensis]QDA60701.1 hypothetical protein FHG12_11565 [Hymenobacter jejuensis]
MLTVQEPESRQEYGTAKGWRLFIYIFVPPLILLFLAVPIIMWGKNDAQLGFQIGLSALMLGFAGFLVYGLLETIKAKHIITTDKLIYEGILRRKELSLARIKGYRIDQNYTHILPLSSADPKIRIGYTSENYQELQNWLSNRYPDLDVLEKEQDTAKLLENDDLGRTPEEREARLANALRTAKCLNIAGGAVAGWLLVYPQPYKWAIAIGLVLPLLATIALWLHQGVIRLDEKRNSAYPSLAIAILGPSSSLLLRALLDFEILDYAPLWPQAATIAAGAALALFAGSREFIWHNDSRTGLLFSIVIYSALYGFAATTIYNCVFDEGEGTRYEAQVLSKHRTSGKHTTYYLHVSPWGPRSTAEDVTVSHDYYDEVQPSDTIQIHAGSGQLHIPWFMVLE